MVPVVVMPVALPAALAAVRIVVERGLRYLRHVASIKTDCSIETHRSIEFTLIEMSIDEQKYLLTCSQSLAPSSDRISAVCCRLCHLSS